MIDMPSQSVPRTLLKGDPKAQHTVLKTELKSKVRYRHNLKGGRHRVTVRDAATNAVSFISTARGFDSLVAAEGKVCDLTAHLEQHVTTLTGHYLDVFAERKELRVEAKNLREGWDDEFRMARVTIAMLKDRVGKWKAVTVIVFFMGAIVGGLLARATIGA